MLLSEASIGMDTPEETVDENCMRYWKARGRFTSCEEIREWFQITYAHIKKGLSDERVLDYLEYIVNIIWLCNEQYLGTSNDYNDEYAYLQENVIGVLED